jgi:5-carboxymethyl-2-hydroxymuconate isomerase
MPHIILEYSRSLEQKIDFSRLLKKMHNMLGGMNDFEQDRIKSRSIGYDSCFVGDNPNRTFVHVNLVFSLGRADSVRDALGRRMLDLLTSNVSPKGMTVSHSVEVRQFERGMYFNDYESSHTS